MKKIITGILGLMLAAGAAGGIAYALFSSQATVEGINISTGNASLLVGPNSTDLSTLFNVGLNLSNLYPGYVSGPTSVWFKNASSVNPMTLNLAGRLTSANPWDSPLRYAAQIRFEVAGSDPVQTTSWTSLNQWNAGDIALPGGNLANDAVREYIMYVRIPLTYEDGTTPSPVVGSEVDNLIAGQSIGNATFTFKGTQVP